jgi:hypothetical protein
LASPKIARLAPFALLLMSSACGTVERPSAVAKPPPSEQASPAFNAEELEIHVRSQVLERLGTEALREASAARTSIMASSYQGRFHAGGPRVKVLVRAPTGWFGWKSGGPVPLEAAAGAELDQLLANPNFWREAPFYPAMDCPDAGATMMVVRHSGRALVTRQGCTPAGLLGKLEEAVLSDGPL